MKSKTRRILLSFLPATLLLVVTVAPALAAPLEQTGTGPAPGGTAGLGGIINNIINLITGIAKPIALLGLVGWGVAQFATPFAPELNQKFQGYSTKLVFGAVLVLGGTQIVDWLWGIG
jgi:type IV secretory pathway VirB2 component (pilin)